MKKIMSLAVALVATVMFGSSVFAVTTTVKNAIVATASFAGEASFTFTLKNVSGDGAAESIDWANKADAFVMGGTTTWVAANQYAEVYAKVTKAGYAVYMNTKNKVANPNLAPNYTEWNGDQGVVGKESYGGLVRALKSGEAEPTSGAYRRYIPILFSYVAQKGVPTLNVAANGTVTETITSDQSDRYLSDIANGGFDKNYTTIAALNGPTFFTKNNGSDVQYPSSAVQNNTAYMYFFGGFKDIIGGDTYATTIYVTEEVE